MSLIKRISGITSASLLLMASMAPTVHAADSSDVFSDQSGNAEVLAADEMDATQGEAVCGGLCVTGVILGSAAVGAGVGYLVNS